MRFWNARDLGRKLAEFQAYDNAARCHASLKSHTPVTFVGGHTVAPADRITCDGFTCGVQKPSSGRPNILVKQSTETIATLDTYLPLLDRRCNRRTW